MKITNVFKDFRVASYITGGLLIAVSLLYIIPALYFHYSSQGSVSSPSVFPKSQTVAKVVPGTPVVSGWPVSISIPSTYINVPVVTGVYNTKSATWNVGLSVAQYVPSTALINNVDGATYIYGHYRPAVFAYLHIIKPGALATVTTSNGYEFTYKYIETYATAPSDTSVLSTYFGPPILLLQTCSGSFFQNRQFYVFDYVSYQKVIA